MASSDLLASPAAVSSPTRVNDFSIQVATILSNGTA